eukprot:COSAG02_NODE_5688_length_4126_cov_2.399056_1_plen_23_part_10
MMVFLDMRRNILNRFVPYMCTIS